MERRRYNSVWDWSTGLILVLTFLAMWWTVLLDSDPAWQIRITIVSLISCAITAVLMLGTYYRVDGNMLVVYQCFLPAKLPIDKIESIVPTKSVLSAPATSMVNRLAIKFSDRRLLRSSSPLVISPVRQDEFIAHLLSINPNIQV